MASKSQLSFAERSQAHPNPLARKLFALAEQKQSNIVLSADVKSTDELLEILEATGPYIIVVKTHIDTLKDFSPATVTELQRLSVKHDFMIFEDRKFTDIGNTVKDQYAGGIFQIYEWAHIVNCLVNPGPGIVQALEQVIQHGGKEDRGVLILAEMTSKGSTCTGAYTKASVDIARQFPATVMGWVATRELSQHTDSTIEDEDFVVFTTGVNISSKGDALGQQYQTPTTAMAGGSDFLIIGRGIYAATDPVEATRQYQREGWTAYRNRIESRQMSSH